MGTSLTVHPFASLADRAPATCPRILINLDRVGSFGSRADDVVLLGKCDEVVRNLCKELGWEDELVKLWSETEGSTETDEEVSEEDILKDLRESGNIPEDEWDRFNTEMEGLASNVGRHLVLDDVAGRIGEKQSAESKGDPEPASSPSPPSPTSSGSQLHEEPSAQPVKEEPPLQAAEEPPVNDPPPTKL